MRYAICGAYVELEIYQSSGGNFFCINMCWKVNSVDCLQVQTETSFTKAENVFASAERTWDAEEESFARLFCIDLISNAKSRIASAERTWDRREKSLATLFCINLISNLQISYCKCKLQCSKEVEEKMRPVSKALR